MAWEEMEKTQSRGLGGYGKDWDTVPCVSINTNGISINGPFIECFMNRSIAVRVCYDVENMMIGIKVVPRGEEQATDFVPRPPSKRSRKAKTIYCHSISKLFPECRKRAYRAARNGSGLIVAQLTDANRAK